MPGALERKYPWAGASWPWFWVFPQATHSKCAGSPCAQSRMPVSETFDRLGLLNNSRIVLRSKTAELVRQEFYGLLMAHFRGARVDARGGATRADGANLEGAELAF
jgi:hypothetical protein